MTTFVRSFGRTAGLAAALLALLADPPLASAQSSRKHHKTPVADADDSPTPSPSPAERNRHGKKSLDSAGASPAATAGNADPAKEKDKPSTADEAAPAHPAKAEGAGNVDAGNANPAAPAATSSIEPGEIEGFDALSEPVRQLLAAALDLTRRHLTYTYGSADPAAGGLDCSGTIYYLLKQRGFGDVPRQASEQYAWVRRKSRFYAVLSKRADTSELDEMRPGDLLFWTGTYHVDRDPPVTHTMIYLGRRKADGHRLMIGSSDGRPYDGQRRNGVSVFDFRMPPARNGDTADAATAAVPDHAPDFAGYGPVPGLADLADAAGRQTAAGHAAPGASARDENPGDDAPAKATKPKRAHDGPRPRT